MSDDDKKRVNIEDLPVPLKELDKEEEEGVTGGLGGTNPTISPTPGTINPIKNPSLTDPKNPGVINPENPGKTNPFNP